jgi:outer membrane receptor protein involved in Fe transport
MNVIKRFFVLFAALLLVSVVANAQTTSSLTGTVTMGGNALPGATVSVSSPNLQGTRSTVSDVNGNFNFGALPPGTYTVKFELESMQTVTKTVTLGLSQTGRADADMRLTSVAEAITVTASAPAVLETTEIQTNFNQKLINDLPIPRNPIAIANLSPGVTTNTVSANQLIISGAPGSESTVMINGAVIQESLRSQTLPLFVEDAIQETTVLTGAISAEYGRFTGGVVNSITKSGGNEFTGSIRDSVTKQNWTAPTRFNEARTNTLNSVYEGTFGGRIIRDRLWFFTDGRYLKNDSNTFFSRSNNFFPVQSTDKRGEVKLTGQVTAKHSLVASYFHTDQPVSAYCFSPCLEPSTLDPGGRNTPATFQSYQYNGIITDNFIIEGLYSKKVNSFVGAGGENHDFANGSWGYNAGGGGYFGAPIFCGDCGNEYRKNAYADIKGTYYLSSKALGTHNIVGGYQNWNENRISNNYQSGSNFAVLTYGSTVDQLATADAQGNLHPYLTAGDIILYTPISVLATGGSKFKTDSLYANDKWDLNSHWQFNLGVRYDYNHGQDANGATRAKDKIVSPRLGAIYDVFANNRLRINASYGKYVAKIAETVGDLGASAGAPASIYYVYEGPDINTPTGGPLNTAQAFQQVYNWFQANGGVTSCSCYAGGSFPGINTTFAGTLTSPNVREYTLGVGSQLGRGFVRADYINRRWQDFYTTSNVPGLHVPDPDGNPLDLNVVSNASSSDNLRRDYRAVELQGSYPLFTRLSLGANYTYAKLQGNVTQESSGSGPIAETVGTYREYRAFAQNNPYGYLSADQRHKGRAWLTYAQPTPVGNFVFSVLQRYDSGLPYSDVVPLSASSIRNAMTPEARASIALYANQPTTTFNYYLNADRAAYRWDATSATDVSINYRLPIGRAELFVEPELINAFNRQATIAGTTTIAVTKAFNPFTQTPTVCPTGQTAAQCTANGFNVRKSATFGTATSNTQIQQPRTFRISAGLRF